MFTSLGRLGHDRDGNGGMEGRITVSYRFTRPGQEITLFSRTITIEAYKHAPLPDQLFVEANPIPVKWAAAELGLIQPALRLPLTPLAPPFHDTVRAALREAGLA